MPGSIDRATIEVGSGWLDFQSAIGYPTGGITLDVTKKNIPIEFDPAGVVDQLLEDVDIEAGLTPGNQVSAAILAMLYPSWFQTPVVDKEIFGGTDAPLVIWGKNGKKYTISAGAVTEMPTFLASSKAKTPFGAMKLRGLCANATTRDTDGSTLAITTEAFSGAAIDGAAVVAPVYTHTWGDSPWDDILTDGGIKYTPKVELTPLGLDGHGVFAMLLKSVTCRAEVMVPQGVTAAAVLALMSIQGAGNRQGASLPGNDLVSDGGPSNPKFTLKKARLVDKVPLKFAQGERRFQSLIFEGTRTSPAAPLFEIVLNDPPA